MTSHSDTLTWHGDMVMVAADGKIRSDKCLQKQAIINYLYNGRISKVQFFRNGVQFAEFNSALDAAEFVSSFGHAYPHCTVTAWYTPRKYARR